MSDLQTREQHLLAMENYAAVRARVWLEAPKPVVIPALPPPIEEYPRYARHSQQRYCMPLIVPGPYQAATGASVMQQMRSVVVIIAAAYALEPKDIYGKRRHAETSLARALCCYVCRESTTWSQSRIGRFLGGKDHSSVLYAVRRVKKLIAAGLVCDPIPLLFPGQLPPAPGTEPNE